MNKCRHRGRLRIQAYTRPAALFTLNDANSHEFLGKLSHYIRFRHTDEDLTHFVLRRIASYAATFSIGVETVASGSNFA